MIITPPHPLASKDGPLTRDELWEIVQYEGLWGYGPEDQPAATQLADEGLVEISHIKEQPVVVKL